jgi:hypothetical protein
MTADTLKLGFAGAEGLSGCGAFGRDVVDRIPELIAHLMGWGR